MIRRMLMAVMMVCLIGGLAVHGTMVYAQEGDAQTISQEGLHALRDDLELQQLISYDSDRQMELSDIVTDLGGEEESISSMGKEVLTLLADAESYKTLGIVLGDDWMSTMLPEDLVIGQRSYHLEQDGLSGDIMVLSDELGNQYTAVRAYSATYGLTYLEVGPEAIRFLVQNGPEEKQYFVVQTLYISDGTFLSNEGFVTGDGRMTGDLTVYLSDLPLESEVSAEESELESVEEANGAEQVQGLSLLDAWAQRYNNGQTYEGAFDSEGKTTVVTPQEQSPEGHLCYAYQERDSETVYLYIEDIPEHVFTADAFGLFTLWDDAEE